jgi:hypothetical protein
MRALVLVVVLGFLSCGKSEQEKYCDCVVDNGCWDSELCPDDPRGSCYWVKAAGPLPAYTHGDESNVCYAVNTDCSMPKCGAEPSSQ